MVAQIEYCPDSFAIMNGPPVCDVIITDPPYEAHCQDNQMSGTTLAKVDLPFAPLAGYEWVPRLVNLAKRWSIVFCTVEDLGRFCDTVGGRRQPKGSGMWVRGGIWYKPNSMGQLTGDRPAASYEGIAVMHPPGEKMRWNGRGGFAFWACNGTRGEKERHPNQKPLKLCLELVNKFSEPGETIFDPFAGSGRIGEACVMLGRNYIGLDNDPEWVDRARERIAAARLLDKPPELHACRLDKEDIAYL